MMPPTTWLTDDTCPDCGTSLTLADDGDQLTVECLTCGTTDSWASDPDDRDTDHLGWGGP